MKMQDGWVLTEPDSLQFLRKVSDTAPEYEAIEAVGSNSVGYYVVQREFNLNDVDEEDALLALTAFGYSSYDDLKQQEGDAAEQLFAEMVFETFESMPDLRRDKFFAYLDTRVEQAILSVTVSHKAAVHLNGLLMDTMVNATKLTRKAYFSKPGATDKTVVEFDFDNGFHGTVIARPGKNDDDRGTITVTIRDKDGKHICTNPVPCTQNLTHSRMKYACYIDSASSGNLNDAGMYEVVVTE